METLHRLDEVLLLSSRRSDYGGLGTLRIHARRSSRRPANRRATPRRPRRSATGPCVSNGRPCTGSKRPPVLTTGEARAPRPATPTRFTFLRACPGLEGRHVIRDFAIYQALSLASGCESRPASYHAIPSNRLAAWAGPGRVEAQTSEDRRGSNGLGAIVGSPLSPHPFYLSRGPLSNVSVVGVDPSRPCVVVRGRVGGFGVCSAGRPALLRSSTRDMTSFPWLTEVSAAGRARSRKRTRTSGPQPRPSELAGDGDRDAWCVSFCLRVASRWSSGGGSLSWARQRCVDRGGWLGWLLAAAYRSTGQRGGGRLVCQDASIKAPGVA